MRSLYIVMKNINTATTSMYYVQNECVQNRSLNIMIFWN